MTHTVRPTQITTILETFGSGDDAEICADLETYIADLEAKQPQRPAHITTILRTLGSQYPARMGASLETYIANLEANQQTAVQGDGQPTSWDSDYPPIWSHQRRIRREQRRRQRALRKQNNYR